jgi:hypothetical protein
VEWVSRGPFSESFTDVAEDAREGMAIAPFPIPAPTKAVSNGKVEGELMCTTLPPNAPTRPSPYTLPGSGLRVAGES